MLDNGISFFQNGKYMTKSVKRKKPQVQKITKDKQVFTYKLQMHKFWVYSQKWTYKESETNAWGGYLISYPAHWINIDLFF